MSTALSDYTTCIQRLLTDIEYHYTPLLTHDTRYWTLFHTWMFDTLGPTSTWSAKQLAELEHSSGTICERAYPHASTELRLIYAKLTAIAILIDDSIEDEAVCAEMVQFSHKLCLGENQENRMLALYDAGLKELSSIFEDDIVLRDLAIMPWVGYINACLMEKQIYDAQRELVNSLPSGGPRQSRNSAYFEGLAPKFPHYLRSKSGIAEAYAAGIFKATKEQKLPFSRFIRALPDLTFVIEVVNDILSFHKEELAGETYNLIHLRTRSLSAGGARGVAGEWTAYDTLHLLCNEVREATHRIDALLRLEECERKMRGEIDPTLSNEVDEVDIEIAKQWRGWRDGYISWHLECRRYKLDFLRPVVASEDGSSGCTV